LQDQEYNSLVRGRLPQHELQRPAIAVCHTFPDCYLLPKDTNSMDVPVSWQWQQVSSFETLQFATCPDYFPKTPTVWMYRQRAVAMLFSISVSRCIKLAAAAG
jgi:hypothetical protein